MVKNTIRKFITIPLLLLGGLKAHANWGDGTSWNTQVPGIAAGKSSVSSGTANGVFYQGGGTITNGAGLTLDSSGNLTGTGNWLQTGSGNNRFVRISTMSNSVVGATETYAFHDTAYYQGTNSSELATGYWMDFFYDQSGAVGSAHGVGLFVRNHGALSNTNFQAAIEGNTLCTSTQPFAYCGSGIFHTKGDTTASGVPFPQASLFFGVDIRIDITSDGFGVTPSTSGTLIFIRPDPGSIGGMPGERFGYYTTDKDIQVVNAGNILKLSISSAAVNGGTLDIHQACGGDVVLTSTASITMSATSWTTSSSNTTDGTFNDGCHVRIINANLTGGRTISFQNSASGLLTNTGATINVGALGGWFDASSIGSVGAWVGGPITK